MKIKGVFVAAILTAVLCISGNLLAYSGDGTGEPNDPYQIWTPEDMNTIGANPADWSKQFKLMTDIDMSAYTGTQFNIIGSEHYEGSFTGVFDGDGHTIQNLTYITTEAEDEVGLFGGAYGATIKNLHLKNVNISSAGNFVGGLLGWNWGSTIEKCSVQGTVSGNDSVGLLVGGNDWIYYTATGLVRSCFAEGTVSGNSGIGGLVGVNVGNIERCYADVAVSGAISVGGLAGENWVCSISDSYAIGTVVGQEDVGGLVGLNGKNDYDGSIQNCYSIGLTSGVTNAGGLVGRNGGGSIGSSFWDTETSGQLTSADGEGKTTEQMQTQSTFADAGWDFDKPIWMITGQDYPRLIWNDPDIDNSGKVDFEDYSILASNWMESDCGFCDSADLTGDRSVNIYDLLVFAAHWLEEDKVSNHVTDITIETAWGYESPSSSTDTHYDFMLQITTDDNVEKIGLLTPEGHSFEITTTPLEWNDETGDFFVGRDFDEDTGDWNWLYEAEFFSPGSLDAFGDGEYVITVYYEGGRSHQTTARFGIPGTTDPIPQPTQVPLYTSFNNGDTVTSPVTFTWQPCTDPAANLIWVGLENDATGQEQNYMLPVATTELSEPLDLDSAVYDVGLGYEVWYQTQNNDGIPLWVGKYSESEYEITVAGEN